jgi:hypothetical protein
LKIFIIVPLQCYDGGLINPKRLGDRRLSQGIAVIGDIARNRRNREKQKL